MEIKPHKISWSNNLEIRKNLWSTLEISDINYFHSDMIKNKNWLYPYEDSKNRLLRHNRK